MTNEEAKFVLDKNMSAYDIRLNRAYDAAIKALEKQIPKKPILEADGYYNGELVYDTWYCPNCDCVYEIDEDYEHCPACGQAIYWSAEK